MRVTIVSAWRWCVRMNIQTRLRVDGSIYILMWQHMSEPDVIRINFIDDKKLPTNSSTHIHTHTHTHANTHTFIRTCPTGCGESANVCSNFNRKFANQILRAQSIWFPHMSMYILYIYMNVCRLFPSKNNNHIPYYQQPRPRPRPLHHHHHQLNQPTDRPTDRAPCHTRSNSHRTLGPNMSLYQPHIIVRRSVTIVAHCSMVSITKGLSVQVTTHPKTTPSTSR